MFLHYFLLLRVTENEIVLKNFYLSEFIIKKNFYAISINYRGKYMRNKLLILSSVCLLFLILSSVGYYSTNQSSFNNKKLVKANTTNQSYNPIFIRTYKKDLNFSSQLYDAVLIKFEFTTNMNISTEVNIQVTWSGTKTGVSGRGMVVPKYFPAGTNNLTVFLGLGDLKDLNNPNTTAGITINITMKIYDQNQNVLNNSYAFPMMYYTYNTSQLSSVIKDLSVFNQQELNFLSRMKTNISLSFERKEYNFGASTNSWGIVGGIGAYGIDSGTVTVNVGGYHSGFVTGQVFDPSNNSFTTADVPVGYPFSSLLMPMNLSLEELSYIFSGGGTYSTKLAYACLYNTSDNIAISSSLQVATGSYSTQFVYNKSTGVLEYYQLNLISSYYNRYEELQQENSTIMPIATPEILNQNFNSNKPSEIYINWTSVGSNTLYSVSLNGTELKKQNDTSFWYNATSYGFYNFQVRAINTTTGLISQASKPLEVSISNSTTSVSPTTTTTKVTEPQTSINSSKTTSINTTLVSTSKIIKTNLTSMDLGYTLLSIAIGIIILKRKNHKKNDL